MRLNNNVLFILSIREWLFFFVVGIFLTIFFFAPFFADIVLDHKIPYRFFLRMR